MRWRYAVLFPLVLALTACSTGSGPGGGGIGLGNVLSGGSPGGTSGPTGTTATNPLPNQPIAPTAPAGAEPSVLGPDGGGGGVQGATVDPSTDGSSSEDFNTTNNTTGDTTVDFTAGPSKAGPVGGAVGSGSAAGMGTVQDTPITVVGNPSPFSPSTGCSEAMACVPTFMSLEMRSTTVADQKTILQTNLQGNVRCINASGETISRLAYRSVLIQDPLFPLEPLPPEGQGAFTAISSEGDFSAVITGPPSRRLRLRIERCDYVTVVEVETPSSVGAPIVISNPPQQVEETRSLQGGFVTPNLRDEDPILIPQLKQENTNETSGSKFTKSKVLKKNFKK